MNKFADPEDADYIHVKEVIEDMVIQAPSLIQRLSKKVPQIMPPIEYHLLTASSQMTRSRRGSQDLICH